MRHGTTKPTPTLQAQEFSYTSRGDWKLVDVTTTVVKCILFSDAKVTQEYRISSMGTQTAKKFAIKLYNVRNKNEIFSVPKTDIPQSKQIVRYTTKTHSPIKLCDFLWRTMSLVV